jgi:hypothetical protein
MPIANATRHHRVNGFLSSAEKSNGPQGNADALFGPARASMASVLSVQTTTMSLISYLLRLAVGIAAIRHVRPGNCLF